MERIWCHLGYKEVADRAMKLNGYVIVAEEGFIVKKYSDVRIEKLKTIDNGNR